MPDPEPIEAILSPHIDYDRGGLIYAGIWKTAALSAAAADLVVIIGTDHYSDHPITLTRQHYATPFGRLQTDLEIVDALAAAIGEETAFDGELFHRVEHSLELPLVWLHHITGGREIPVVPILCGNLEPGSRLQVAFTRALREATRGRRVFTVISGDLSHVGPAFGGERQSDNGRSEVRSKDGELLSLLVDGNSEAFIAAVRASQNATNVCGAYPLYLGLTTFGYERGIRIGYDQCSADDAGESFVSIGGIAFKSRKKDH
jgi:AmmeMemoRadiSam system protein B